MSVTVQTDEALDRILSVRVAQKIPLAPDISLVSAADAVRLHGLGRYYTLMGVSDHPFVAYLRRTELDTAVAVTLSSAPYMDRLSHFSAWGSASPVEIVDAIHDPERIIDQTGRRSRERMPGPPPGGGMFSTANSADR